MTHKKIQKWKILTFLALSVSLIVIDGTIVNVSLPVIMRDLHFTFTDAEWIVTIYSLVFSSLLISTGKIADILGRRKILITGIVVFIIGSVMASLSNTLLIMLVSRFIQGIGGAIVLPTTLSTVNTIFKGKDRVIAFAVWGSVISGMAALGPFLGGFFTTYMDWRWIFWINIPIGIIIVIGSLMFIPETYGENQEGMFDFVGLILSIITFGTIVYGLIEGKDYGWWKVKGNAPHINNLSIIPYALGIGLSSLILLVLWELYLTKNKKSPLIALNIFKFKSFSIGNITACIVAIGEFGLLFLLPLYLQNVLFMSAMKSGLVLSLMGVSAFFAGGFATPFVNKTSSKTVVSTGLGLETLSFIGFFLTIKPNSSVWLICLWLIIYGIGLGFASAQLTSIVMVDVPDNQAGQGSSIQSTVRQLGSALGIAIIGTLFISFLWHDVPGSLKQTDLSQVETSQLEKSVIKSAGASISGIKNSPASSIMPITVKNKVVTKLSHSFTHSIVKTIGVAGSILFISFVITFLLPK